MVVPAAQCARPCTPRATSRSPPGLKRTQGRGSAPGDLGWSSETTLEVRVAWTGGHEDLFAFAELLREVLATHCGELGVERVICRPPELTHPDATVRTGA